MKTRSAPQTPRTLIKNAILLAVVFQRRRLGERGFFNLRLLIGLFIVLAGVCLALAGVGAFSALTASMAQGQQKNKIITNSKDPLVPTDLIVPKFTSWASTSK